MFNQSLFAISLLAGCSAAKTASRVDTSTSSYDAPFGATGMGLNIKSVDSKLINTLYDDISM